MAEIDLEAKLEELEAAIAELKARPVPADLAARIEAQDAKIVELEVRVRDLEQAGGNNLRIDKAGTIGPTDRPDPSMFKKVGDWLTDGFGRWWNLTSETEVELWREDYVKRRATPT